MQRGGIVELLEQVIIRFQHAAMGKE